MKMVKNTPLILDLASAPWGRVKGLEKRLREAAGLTLASLPANLLPVARQAQFTLLLTSDKAVQILNFDYRGKNKATNVLSFPQFERRDLLKQADLQGPVYVGDIAVAHAFVVKEAKEERKILLDHVTHLMIHGILHLFGYDHDTAGRAARMEKLEKEVMATLGLPDPYAPIEESAKRRSAKRKR